MVQLHYVVLIFAPVKVSSHLYLVIVVIFELAPIFNLYIVCSLTVCEGIGVRSG